MRIQEIADTTGRTACAIHRPHRTFPLRTDNGTFSCYRINQLDVSALWR